MESLYACPFCRQLFKRGEVQRCPECDVAVAPLAELPPSIEAEALEPAAVPPEEELLDWGYAGRGRGPLLLLALLGIAVFAFAPWLEESAPEIGVLTGVAFARKLSWLWSAGVAWVIVIGIVATRRTVRQMRGARLAVALMAAMVLSTVLLRLWLPIPKQPVPIPRIFRWGWGLYAAGGLAALALFYAWRFGGALDDLPTQQPRQGDETLH